MEQELNIQYLIMEKIVKLDPVILHSNYDNRPFSIDITYVPDGKPKPLILHVHGFKGFKDWGYFNLIANHAALRGFIFVKMNFSRNGTTPEHPVDFVELEAFGQNNFSIEQDDMGKVIDFVYASDFPVGPGELNLQQLYLTGHSRGGAAVILKGYHDQRIKAIASWAGVNNLGSHYTPEEVKTWKDKGVTYVENSRTKQLMPLYFQLVEDYLKNEEKLNVPLAIKKMNIPFLVIHGTHDPTVPVRMAYQTKEWNPSVHLDIIEGADHVFGGAHPWDRKVLPAAARVVIEDTLAFFNTVT